MSNTTCFFADGVVSNDIFCSLPGKNVCCGSGWECLNNGLCMNPQTSDYSQGTCIDRSYSNCSVVCEQGIFYDLTFSSCYHKNTHSSQAQFGHNTKTNHCDPNDNKWCCGADADCCTSNSTKALQPFPFQAYIPTQTNDSIQTSSTVPATETSNFSSTSSLPSSNAHLNPRIGIVVGLPIGIVLISILIFIILYRQKAMERRKIEAAAIIAAEEIAQMKIGGSIHVREQELEVPDWELDHPQAPRHELSPSTSPRYELF